MVGQAAPSSLPLVPPLVGREREQAALGNALDAALAGHGALALIGGEAGIGKTALAESLLAKAASQGALVLVGCCYDLSETPPYGPWAEALDLAPTDGGLPDLPAAVGLPGRGGDALDGQGTIQRRVLAYLAAVASRRPLVVLLDDLHWADPASLDLLRVVARALAAMPLLLVAAYRADELTRRHPLSQLLPLLEREARAARLVLRPLAPPALGALVASRYALPAADAARLVTWLAGRAEGNAFFTVQLLRALEDEGVLRQASDAWVLGDLATIGLPVPLRQVIDARVDRLGEEARALLECAAIIGQAVPLALWAAVADVAEDVLLAMVEAAAEARLLAVSDDGAHATFAHALIREALYTSVPPTRRRARHRRIAEALADTHGADPDAVAYHYRRAGDSRAVAWLVHAGERAQRAAATLTAAGRFEAAVALLETDEEATAERGWLLIRIASLRRWSAPPLTVALFEEAERLGETTGDRLLAAAAQFCRGESRSYTGAFRHGLEELAAGLAALEALPPEALAPLGSLVATGVVGTGISGGTLTAGLALAGRFADLRALSARLAAGTPVTAAAGRSDEFWHSLAIVAAADGHPDEAHDLWVRARANFRAKGNEVMVGSAILWELVWCALPYHADRIAARRGLAATGEQAWERAAGAHGDASARVIHLPVLALEGAWVEARALGEAALTSVVSALRRYIYAAEVGRLLRAQGHGAAAYRLVGEYLPLGPDTAPGDSTYLGALALQRRASALALDAGDLPLARRWLMAHDTWLDWGGAVLGRAEGTLGWAAYHRTAGDLVAARVGIEAALAYATEPRQPLALLAAHRALGELDAVTGRFDDARTHLDVALALADACAAPYERALTLLALAECQAASAEARAAVGALAEARALLAGLGAAPALARGDALAARLGAPTSGHPTGASPVRLTPREAEILRLIAAGKSNRAMAAALGRSERTVERHIEHLYRKIDAHSKADATAFAFRHGLA